MGSRWKAHLPSLRWSQFRLCHPTKDGAYMPIRMTQIVGGKWWSLSLTRTGPARKADPVEITPEQLDRALVAYRRGARMSTWEECITHDADRTLSGLRAAFTEIGLSVGRRAAGSPSSEVDQDCRCPAPTGPIAYDCPDHTTAGLRRRRREGGA